MASEIPSRCFALAILLIVGAPAPRVKAPAPQDSLRWAMAERYYGEPHGPTGSAGHYYRHDVWKFFIRELVP